MARNGKVRNQAPKVEKQEKPKKTPVGRAKKRLQYKRRIINVDPNDKRKKGPNAGAGKKEVWGGDYNLNTKISYWVNNLDEKHIKFTIKYKRNLKLQKQWVFLLKMSWHR